LTFFFVSFPAIPTTCLGAIDTVFYKQAALAHLESIIYDPHHSDPSHDGTNGVNGTDEGVSGDGGETVANMDTAGRDTRS